MNLDAIIKDMITQREVWSGSDTVMVSTRIEHSGGQSHVWGTDETGTEKVIFSYYPDELSFSAAEFEGLTLSACRQIHSARDIAYLRS